MWAMRGTCWLYPVPITQFTLTRIFCWILSVAQHLTASAQTAGVRLVLILRGLPFRGDLSTEACLRIVEVCSEVQREGGYRLSPSSLTKHSSQETQLNSEVLCSLATCFLFYSKLCRLTASANSSCATHLPS